MIILPETKGMSLPETIEEIEKIYKKKEDKHQYEAIEDASE